MFVSMLLIKQETRPAQMCLLWPQPQFIFQFNFKGQIIIFFTIQTS